jgi:hypothetical protein
MRYLTARLAAAGLAAAAMAFTGAAAAGASTAGPRPTTPQCLATANCVSPDYYADGAEELALSDAGGIFQNAAVTTDGADSTSAAQDFRFVFHGTVASLTHNGDGPYQYGLTQADFAAFGSDPVFSLQAAPFGSPSNKCVANLHNTVLTLRTCSVHRWQLFIQDGGTGFGVPFLSADGSYYLGVLGSNSVAGHDAVTGKGEGGQARMAFPDGSNPQNWDGGDAVPGS